MHVHFVTYGDNLYATSRYRIINEALKLDVFETCYAYTPDRLGQTFKDRFKALLKQKRGGGYWCWKPYAVLKTLKNIPENHWIFYADAGCSFIPERKGQISALIELMESQGKSFSALKMHHLEKHYTKADLFQYFNIASDDNNIRNTGQYVGGIFFVKNTPKTRDIFEDMVKVMETRPDLIDDTPSVHNNDTNFIEHRHDQSLFSIVRKINDTMVFVMEDDTFRGGSFCQATRLR